MTKSNSKTVRGGARVAKLQSEPRQPDRVDQIPQGTNPGEQVRQAALTAPELHVHQLLGILRRRRTLILVTVLFGAMLAFAATTLIPPKFTARAQMAVEPERSVSTSDVAVRTASVDALAIDTQMTMLVARDHLRSVLATLADDPAFTATLSTEPSHQEPERSQTGPDTESPEGLLAELERRAAGFLLFIRTSISPVDGVPTFDEFERTLRVDQERQSRIISVRYTSNSAEQASIIANRVVELYVQTQTDSLKQASEAELTELGLRIADAERSLETAEAAIRQKLAAGQNDTDVGEAAGRPLRQLQREVTETAQLYVNLLERQKLLRGRLETSEAPVRVLSLAEPPERPSSAGAMYFILPAIVLSLIAGGVLAVILERFDRTLRSEHQVHDALGIPCCALAPKLGWMHRSRPHDYLMKKPFSPYAEAIRSIGASLKFAAPSSAAQVVLISSSVRGEGRTTLAASLAAYSTQLHSRVLLIDLDFRHPAIARTLRLKPRHGLIDLIASNRPLEDAVKRIPRLGLDILPMPDCTVDPVTLFASGELQNVLKEIRNRYDFIVIDSPPLIGVTESGLLASLADKILFVVKWGSTRRDVAQNAIGELRALGWPDWVIAERVQAVVTHVDLKRHASYEYGDAVELFVRRGNHYSPPQKVKSLADLSKADAKSGGDEEAVQVAAE